MQKRIKAFPKNQAKIHNGGIGSHSCAWRSAAEQSAAFRFTYPVSHSFEEINQYAAAHPYDVNLADVYEIQPDIANQEWNAQPATGKLDLTKDAALRDRLTGKLTDATLQNTLSATNFMRYHAGCSRSPSIRRMPSAASSDGRRQVRRCRQSWGK